MEMVHCDCDTERERGERERRGARGAGGGIRWFQKSREKLGNLERERECEVIGFVRRGFMHKHTHTQSKHACIDTINS